MKTQWGGLEGSKHGLFENRKSSMHEVWWEVEEDAGNAIQTTRRQRMATQRTDRILLILLSVPEAVIRFTSS